MTTINIHQPASHRQKLHRLPRLVGVDAQLHGLRRRVAVGERQEALLVAGVRCVGDQLAQEHVLRCHWGMGFGCVGLKWGIQMGCSERRKLLLKQWWICCCFYFFAEGSLEGTILLSTSHVRIPWVNDMKTIEDHSGKGTEQMWDLKLKDSHAGYTNWYADMLLY